MSINLKVIANNIGKTRHACLVRGPCVDDRKRATRLVIHFGLTFIADKQGHLLIFVASKSQGALKNYEIQKETDEEMSRI